jgi:gamma-glutamyltranspeptidase/glutathione hydrolase
VRGTFKEYEIVGPPLPTNAAVGIIEAMNILENVDLQSMGHYTKSADSFQWLIETLRVVFDDARKYSGVNELDEAVAEVLTSKEYAKSRYRLLRYRIEEMKRGQTSDTAANETKIVEKEDMMGTNHVAAIDEDGNVCSLTHTIYGGVYGTSGLFVGGIALNAAGQIQPPTFPAQPGERMLSGLTPMIVFKQGKPFFAAGSSGWILNPFFIIVNVLVWDQDFKQAQEAPRFRAPSPDSNEIRAENRFDDEMIEELERRGYQFRWSGPFSMPNAQVAGIDPTTGVRYGASDPRAIGQAAGQ